MEPGSGRPRCCSRDLRTGKKSMPSLPAYTLFHSNNQNQYVLDQKKGQMLLCHPVLKYFLKLHFSAPGQIFENKIYPCLCGNIGLRSRGSFFDCPGFFKYFSPKTSKNLPTYKNLPRRLRRLFFTYFQG